MCGITFKEFPGRQINLGWLYKRIDKLYTTLCNARNEYEELKAKYRETCAMIISLQYSQYALHSRYVGRKCYEGTAYCVAYPESKLYDKLMNFRKPMEDLYLRFLAQRSEIQNELRVKKFIYRKIFVEYQRLQTICKQVYDSLKKQGHSATWDIPLKCWEFGDTFLAPKTLIEFKKSGHHFVIMDEQNNKYAI